MDSLNSKQSQMDRCNVLAKKKNSFFHWKHCESGFIVLKSSSVQSIKIVVAYSHSVLSFLFGNSISRFLSKVFSLCYENVSYMFKIKMARTNKK